MTADLALRNAISHSAADARRRREDAATIAALTAERDALRATLDRVRRADPILMDSVDLLAAP